MNEVCECEFDPAPEGEDPELFYHYRSRCPMCGHETLSLHCIHDRIQGVCVNCGRTLPTAEDYGLNDDTNDLYTVRS